MGRVRGMRKLMQTELSKCLSLVILVTSFVGSTRMITGSLLPFQSSLLLHVVFVFAPYAKKSEKGNGKKQALPMASLGMVEILHFVDDQFFISFLRLFVYALFE